MSDDTAIVHVEQSTPGACAIVPVEAMKQQVQQIQAVMHDVMKRDEHYGVIPGCGDKPTLLKPGAEKLCLTFGFGCRFNVTQKDLPGGHREYDVRCILFMRSTGRDVGEGVGCASTMEKKWRMRKQTTPTGDPIPGDYQKNKGAYRAKGYTCSKIDNEWAWCRVEEIEHPNPADNFNTVLKMAKKRAYVDAVLTATSASDIFTQDLEELRPDDTDQTPHEPAGDGEQSQTQQRGSGRRAFQSSASSPPSDSGQQDTGAEQPGDAGGPMSGRFMVTSVEIVKEGETNGKPWSIKEITTGKGASLQTFSDSIAEDAVEAMESGRPVQIEYVQNKYGYQIKTLTALDKPRVESDEAPWGGEVESPPSALDHSETDDGIPV